MLKSPVVTCWLLFHWNLTITSWPLLPPMFSPFDLRQITPRRFPPTLWHCFQVSSFSILLLCLTLKYWRISSFWLFLSFFLVYFHTSTISSNPVASNNINMWIALKRTLPMQTHSVISRQIYSTTYLIFLCIFLISIWNFRLTNQNLIFFLNQAQ